MGRKVDGEHRVGKAEMQDERPPGRKIRPEAMDEDHRIARSGLQAAQPAGGRRQRQAGRADARLHIRLHHRAVGAGALELADVDARLGREAAAPVAKSLQQRRHAGDRNSGSGLERLNGGLRFGLADAAVSPGSPTIISGCSTVARSPTW